MRVGGPVIARGGEGSSRARGGRVRPRSSYSYLIIIREEWLGESGRYGGLADDRQSLLLPGRLPFLLLVPSRRHVLDVRVGELDARFGPELLVDPLDEAGPVGVLREDGQKQMRAISIDDVPKLHPPLAPRPCSLPGPRTRTSNAGARGSPASRASPLSLRHNPLGRFRDFWPNVM